MSAFVYNVEESDFDQLVVARSHDAPVLVDISAEWCAPCRVLGPLLHKLADAYEGKFLLGLVDADENMRIAGRHKATASPLWSLTVTAWRSIVSTARRAKAFCANLSMA